MLLFGTVVSGCWEAGATKSSQVTKAVMKLIVLVGKAQVKRGREPNLTLVLHTVLQHDSCPQSPLRSHCPWYDLTAWYTSQTAAIVMLCLACLGLNYMRSSDNHTPTTVEIIQSLTVTGTTEAIFWRPLVVRISISCGNKPKRLETETVECPQHHPLLFADDLFLG